TSLIPTAQLPNDITHSYRLGIVQTRQRWKDNSNSFPNLT
ncbi:hypothetical protein MTR67_051725, partial [Solanum verrucosum]